MASTPATADPQAPLHKAPGRGAAIIVYGLFLGSVMGVVTAPIGAAIAHRRRGRVTGWVDSHLRFQIRTFWLGLAFGLLGLGGWQLLGVAGLPPSFSWTYGYLLFTVGLIWMVGRCGVGLHRLLANRPIARPASLAFGGAAITLED
ncbi:DUF4870 family protein [Halomonas koreensis]|uniref:Uncharacterized protein n=1 Tax=Halomonas koreensis TaxID=245385 RepID=A0ABU1G1M0_9GAMM|nr:hypothetical protein [Halomonas koreensis]MDR5866827.1 hypothetical protein [Halomonas koreensis]